jgi:hypothetical protein
MSPEAMFSVANVLALPGWVLLLLAPRSRWTAGLVCPVVLPLLLAVFYLYLVLRYMPGAEGGFGSLPEVQQFFQRPELLLAGWVHYLAFDLFIGSWEVRDSLRLQISRWLMAPCLVLTFLLGPVGLLLYFVFRTVKAKGVALEH